MIGYLVDAVITLLAYGTVTFGGAWALLILAAVARDAHQAGRDRVHAGTSWTSREACGCTDGPSLLDRPDRTTCVCAVSVPTQRSTA